MVVLLFLLISYALLPCLVERRNDTRESNNKVSTCPCTVETGDQKYDELKWESSIISEIEKQQLVKHPLCLWQQLRNDTSAFGVSGVAF